MLCDYHVTVNASVDKISDVVLCLLTAVGILISTSAQNWVNCRHLRVSFFVFQCLNNVLIYFCDGRVNWHHSQVSLIYVKLF